MKKELNKIFSLLKKNKRLIFIIILSLLIINIITNKYIIFLKQLIYSIILFSISSLTKVYHRFIKTTISIDLIFFSTILITFAYKNILLSIVLGIISLIIADFLSDKLSYTSLISIFCLSITIILSIFLININNILKLNIILISFFLLILYEFFASLLYNSLGSSKEKIILFLISHFSFNFFLIINFLEYSINIIK